MHRNNEEDVVFPSSGISYTVCEIGIVLNENENENQNVNRLYTNIVIKCYQSTVINST